MTDFPFVSKKHELPHIVSNHDRWYIDRNQSGEANMILNTQAVTQEPMFKELKDWGDTKSLF